MSSPGRLRHRVGATIAERGLWRPGQRVVVAVSGGMDSVALLDLLSETAGWHQGRLEVATVDHGTRPGSAADADFVAGLAAARGLASHRFDLRLGEGADEDRCRTARYAALESLGADAVAVAHHRDDQAETVLVQLLRGTGTAGLAGMGWRRGAVVRPLLDVPRADLLAWAHHRGLSWVEDPSNSSSRFLRNRVRHEVLPLLENVRPGASAALARSATLAALDGDLVAGLLAAVPEASPGPEGWSRAWIAEGPEPLVRRALLASLPEAMASHVDAILSAARRGSGAVELPGVRVIVDQGRVRLLGP